MSEMTLVALAYVLGVVGMAGVWLIPAHLWSILVTRRIGVELTTRPSDMVCLMTVLIVLAFGCFAAAATLPRVFQCLEDSTHCSANRAGGLVKLDVFGAAVVIVEAYWLVSRLILTWWHRHLANKSLQQDPG